MFSYWHHIALALSVSVSQLLTGPPAAFGQTTATDTIAGRPSDSLAAAPGDSLAPEDTLAAPGDTLADPDDSLAALGYTGSLAPPDTVDTIPRSDPDSVPPGGSADTTASDSVPAASARDSARPAASARDPARPAAPVDSVLSAACGGPGGSAGIARDLLLVVFAPETGAEERDAAAESVGGKVLGSPEPGAYYLKLRANRGEAGLRAAADQLSLLTHVRQVGTRACPPTPR